MAKMETSRPSTLANSTYSTILKLNGSNILLDPVLQDGLSKFNSANSAIRLFCRDLNSQAKADIQLYVLNNSGVISQKGTFHLQKDSGHSLAQDDLAIFMTSPVQTSHKAAFAFDFSISQHSSSIENLTKSIERKLGTAYIYLEPQFATSGSQRMPIVAPNSPSPIGQIQVDYLIVKNPNAFGVNVPIPEWLCKHLHAGHRGAGSGCRADLPRAILENTVESFNFAFRNGANMCELDVMCTSDGVPVVYHNYILGNLKPGASQISQLTLDELRKVKNSGIHDKNCSHNLDDTDTTSNHCCRPFPTLAEVLLEVDPDCALNIELKCPQMLYNGKSEAQQNREINDFVDRILDCIYKHDNGRAIILSTFNANVAIMLRLKQAQYPVHFLTTGDSKRFSDPITKTVKNAIHFAEAFGMAGINPNVATLNENLVRYAQDSGLLVHAWGRIDSAQAVRELRNIGTNGVIYDRIDLIKPRD